MNGNSIKKTKGKAVRRVPVRSKVILLLHYWRWRNVTCDGRTMKTILTKLAHYSYLNRKRKIKTNFLSLIGIYVKLFKR